MLLRLGRDGVFLFDSFHNLVKLPLNSAHLLLLCVTERASNE
jgi:hypothetical protein